MYCTVHVTACIYGFASEKRPSDFPPQEKFGYFSFTSSVKTLLIYLIIDTCAKELFKIKFVLENIRSKYSVFVSLKLSYKKYNCIGYFLVRAWCPSCMFFLQKRHNNFTRMSCIFLPQSHTLISWSWNSSQQTMELMTIRSRKCENIQQKMFVIRRVADQNDNHVLLI